MKTNKKSPLKDKPLRNPGQSIDEYIQSSIMEQVNTYVIAIVFSIFLAVFEWYRQITSLQLSPWSFTIAAIFIVPYPLYRLIQLRTKLTRHRLARDGEMAIGQYLEKLREKGYSIFHDIVGDGFNLDHVIISEHGIFIIETKTYSKPNKRQPVILFDGDSIQIDKGIDASHLITQVRAQQDWLKNIINESTGKNIDVKPVIVFPGWYINSTKSAFNNNLWVLNPKALPKFIENSPNTLSFEDHKLVAFHLSRFIRRN
jgi:hypothetical protein